MTSKLFHGIMNIPNKIKEKKLMEFLRIKHIPVPDILSINGDSTAEELFTASELIVEPRDIEGRDGMVNINGNVVAAVPEGSDDHSIIYTYKQPEPFDMISSDDLIGRVSSMSADNRQDLFSKLNNEFTTVVDKSNLELYNKLQNDLNEALTKLDDDALQQ